jgi:hypothetical protein
MSYDSKVYNVMIASPNDVPSERNIVKEVVYEWNAVHSQSRKIVLLPIGWETHSSPEMGSRAQAILNDQILNKCDLLVGIFWTRIGTETGGYLSGTVEEIERHVASGKPAMLYFYGKPVEKGSVDKEQYSNLKKFRESCQERGLYATYDNHSDFREKFYHHLQIKVNEHEIFKEAGNPTAIQVKIVKSETKIPHLSDEAKVLLKEASMDNHGTILHFRYLGGTSIQTNGKNLITNQDRRHVAKWEAALKELLEANLIVARGDKGEIFEVSDKGYQIAEMIEL